MISLARWLEHLNIHLPMAREGSDPEGIHQVRVAGRRLRVWLELGGFRMLEDDLAWLVQGAGKVRDLEVLLGHPRLPKTFQNWAKEQLKQRRAALIPMLDSPRLKGLRLALSTLPPLERPQAEARLGHFLQQAQRRYEKWQHHRDFEHLHALRRALRRLRYAREWLGMNTEAIQGLQEVLGRVGDLHFTLGYLEAFEAVGTQALPLFKKRLEAQLNQALEQAKTAGDSQKNTALA